MLALLPSASGAITAARAVPAAGQLVSVGGTGAVVTDGERLLVGVVPTVTVWLAVGVGVTVPPELHAEKKRIKQAIGKA